MHCIWAYQGNPFGELAPTSTTGYVLNLHYPGQYYDAESGTNYNVFRNYEPAVGRYQQSDPLGLLGGISTYAYVGSNPLSSADPLGLWQFTVTGGEYFAISITFGDNSGQWNFGAYGGFGEGLSGSFNPNDSGTEDCGSYYGIEGSGRLGAFDGIDGDFWAGFAGGTSAGLTLNDPIDTYQAWGFEEVNGEPQPLGSPSLVLGVSTFVGIGGTWFGSK